MFVFVITIDVARRLRCIRNLFCSYRAASTFLCKGSPLQYSDHGIRGRHSSHSPFIRRTSTRARLTILSKLSTASHIYALAIWRMKEAVRPFAVDDSLHCRGCWPLFREQDCSSPPFVLSFVEEITIMLPLTYVEHPAG